MHTCRRTLFATSTPSVPSHNNSIVAHIYTLRRTVHNKGVPVERSWIVIACYWPQVIVTPRQRQMRRTRCPRHRCAAAWDAQGKTNHARYCACDGTDWNVSKVSTTKVILCQIVDQFERTRTWRRTLNIIFPIKGFAFGTHQHFIPFVITAQWTKHKNRLSLCRLWR